MEDAENFQKREFDVEDYIVLTASRQTIHDRILTRGEDEDCWCIKNLDMAMKLSSEILGGIAVNTDGITAKQVAKYILNNFRLSVLC